METGLAPLHKANLPPTFWTFTFHTTTFLINRMPTTVLNFQSLFEALFHLAPNYLKLKIFGCLCYPYLRPYTSHKLQPRSHPCVFIGYLTEYNAYKCYDPETNKIYTSRHVVFVEDTFPFQSHPTFKSTYSSWTLPPPYTPTPIHLDHNNDTQYSHPICYCLPISRVSN